MNRTSKPSAQHCTPRIAIVGAGASGICMGARLRQAGFDNFFIYERGDDVGGVWRANTYPGLWCDVPSSLYSYTFAPNPRWSHLFADRDEIHTYLRNVTADYDLTKHLKINTEVVEASFSQGRWRLTSTRGTEHFDMLICATGILVNPAIPTLPGIETFSGAAFHSAQWDHTVNLAGRRVAVIGNGSTGVQLTGALAPNVQRLLLFQRTAQWILPLPNKPNCGATTVLHTHLPGYTRLTNTLWRTIFESIIGRAVVQPGWQRQLIAWVCKQYLNTVRDPQLRAKLTPSYQVMCKRLVRSTNFYQSIQKPNVDLITKTIDTIEPDGIRTIDGALHEVDTIVYATGFHASDFMHPMKITGNNGTDLNDAWRAGPRTYNAIATPGFPNLFMMAGPNSPYAHDSVLRIAEAHANYIIQWVKLLHQGKVTTAAPTESATKRFQEKLHNALPRTALTAGCSNWYQTPDGQLLIWPWTAAKHRRLLSQVDLNDFHLETETNPPAGNNVNAG